MFHKQNIRDLNAPGLGAAASDSRYTKYHCATVAQGAVSVIDYENSGLGYAGDPNGPDVAPIVTVRLTGVTFTPLVFAMFGGDITLPAFRSSLTLEDGAGSVSN
ncbi:MAG: hypothetical protein ABIR87_06705 [Sphingomicrobium sp.]